MIIIAYIVLIFSLAAFMCFQLCALALYEVSDEYEVGYINMFLWSFIPLGTAVLSLIAIGALR